MIVSDNLCNFSVNRWSVVIGSTWWNMTFSTYAWLLTFSIFPWVELSILFSPCLYRLIDWLIDLQVECYNTLTCQWTHVRPMLTKRCRHGVASLNGKLYVAGGYDGNVFLKSVECFDPMANEWTRVADMQFKRSRVALSADCGKLYAIGGYDGTANLKSVEVYDPEKNIWTIAPPMCAHEGGVGVGVIPLQPKQWWGDIWWVYSDSIHQVCMCGGGGPILFEGHGCNWTLDLSEYYSTWLPWLRLWKAIVS